MKFESLQSKVNGLFSSQDEKKHFENHMPRKVGEFLVDASKGEMNSQILKEDIAFAHSISKAMQH